MKKKSMFVLAAIILIVPQLVSAFEFTVQPRFKTGVMYYEYKQDAFQSAPRGIPRGCFPTQQAISNTATGCPSWEAG
jgi:hypothetical protein